MLQYSGCLLTLLRHVSSHNFAHSFTYNTLRTFRIDEPIFMYTHMFPPLYRKTVLSGTTVDMVISEIEWCGFQYLLKPHLFIRNSPALIGSKFCKLSLLGKNNITNLTSCLFLINWGPPLLHSAPSSKAFAIWFMGFFLTSWISPHYHYIFHQQN